MTNKFNLNNAGNRRFVSQRKPRTKWNENESVLEITNDKVILSKNLCQELGIKDNGVVTLYYLDDGLYVGNITNQVIENANEIALKVTKVQGYNSDYYGARTARNQNVIVKAREKAQDETGNLLYPVGQYRFTEAVSETEFPIVKVNFINNTVAAV